MQQRKLIIFIVIIFFISSASLFAIGNKFNDLNFSQNWWSVYFSDPKSNDLNFIIENHSENLNFHYIISKDKDTVYENDVKVENGKSENIKPARIDMTGRITIQISSGSEKKEIYKNF